MACFETESNRTSTFSLGLRCFLLHLKTKSGDYFSLTKGFLLGREGKGNECFFDHSSSYAFLARQILENLFRIKY